MAARWDGLSSSCCSSNSIRYCRRSNNNSLDRRTARYDPMRDAGWDCATLMISKVYPLAFYVECQFTDGHQIDFRALSVKVGRLLLKVSGHAIESYSQVVGLMCKWI